MSFREPTLDDRKFDDLVRQARKRVSERCPTWTEHNVSDPGITLIETFAWMTEMLSYRLNRVPERVHLALLELLDIELKPPVAASTDLRFRLADAMTRAVRIPARETEVTTASSGGAVFRVTDDFTIRPVRLETLVIQRQDYPPGTLITVAAADGTATPTGIEEPAFSTPPRPGDALYFGFRDPGGRDPLGRLVLRIDVDVTRASGVGIKPKDPPLRWEVARSAGEVAAAGGTVEGEAGWVEVELLEDTTGGFNRGGGQIELQMPPETARTSVAGRNLHWVRCVVTERTRSGKPSPRYTEPPRVHRVSAYPVGALVPAEAATTIKEEVIGESDGTSGQTFTVRRWPALELRAGETLEVRNPGAEHWVRWEHRDSFEKRGPEDPCFRFHPAIGRVELGPAIRDVEEGWKQHGAVPERGARLRMSRYRYGGGERGSVDARALTQLRNPIPGIVSVTNPAPTRGGQDAETPAAARRRAAEELRTRYRAVTAEDFEYMAEKSSKVARARCIEPAAPGQAIQVHILPAVDPDRVAKPDPLPMALLQPREELLEDVARFLDKNRVVGTRVEVRPVPMRAVTVFTDVRIHRFADPHGVEHAVYRALYRYLNPYIGGKGAGWRFGAPLNLGDLHKIVFDVDGVRDVVKLHMYGPRPDKPSVPAAHPAGPRIELAANELLCSGTHWVRAVHALVDEEEGEEDDD